LEEEEDGDGVVDVGVGDKGEGRRWRRDDQSWGSSLTGDGGGAAERGRLGAVQIEKKKKRKRKKDGK